MSDMKPLARRRLCDDIANELRSAIIGGTYALGAHLPTERRMATDFAVNRCTVREAVKRLEIEGLVSVRQGIGIVVLEWGELPQIEEHY